MKNQYFGDINDYRKYGLLRSLAHTSDLKILVAWMLTPDDGSTDGKFISYLQSPNEWEKYDPYLYSTLRDLLSDSRQRNVALIEKASVLERTTYHSTLVPEKALERDLWFNALLEQSKSHDFVFLDPDNGIEVKSKPYGRKHSSKYLYWREIESLWNDGKSLLIYQHFIREKRSKFIRRTLEALLASTKGSLVEAFSTPHVVFLMVLQPEHHHLHELMKSSVQKNWEGQIHHWN